MTSSKYLVRMLRNRCWRSGEVKGASCVTTSSSSVEPGVSAVPLTPVVAPSSPTACLLSFFALTDPSTSQAKVLTNSTTSGRLTCSRSWLNMSLSTSRGNGSASTPSPRCPLTLALGGAISVPFAVLPASSGFTTSSKLLRTPTSHSSVATRSSVRCLRMRSFSSLSRTSGVSALSCDLSGVLKPRPINHPR